MSIPAIRAPFVMYEEVTLAANQNVTTSSRPKWSNHKTSRLHLERLLFDANSLAFQLRMSKSGGYPIILPYLLPTNLANTVVMNLATDNAQPLALFDQAQRWVIPGRNYLRIDLEDLSGSSRTYSVSLVAQTSEGKLYVLGERVAVPASAVGTVEIYTQDCEYLEVQSLSLNEETTGAAGLLRNLKLGVYGGGLPNWSLDRFRASTFFWSRNADGIVFTPPEPLILEPGEYLQFELLDTGLAGGTMYLGGFGWLEDVRSVA